MFRNYFRVALRMILKNRSYIIINTVGLGIALACCITSYLLIAYNIEFDNFHRSEQTESIFRLHAHVVINENDPKVAVGAPRPIAPTAATDFAGIKRFTRFAGNATGGASVSYQVSDSEIKTFGEFVVFADSTFFDMFDFPLQYGSHEAFKDLQTVFINDEIAKKYFGDANPIGETLSFGFSRGVTKQMTVGGVIGEVPVNTSLYIGIVLRFEHFEEMRDMDQPVWGDWNVPATFFELEDPSQAAAMGPLFDRFKSIRNEAFEEQEVLRYTLEPYLDKLDRNDLTWTYLNVPIPLEPLMIFVILAVLILLVSCFNLTNTSIAMTTNRLKEIGVRKAVGAHRQQIIFQFFLETVIIILLSLAVGYMVSRIIVPEFAAMWGLPYGLEDLNGANLVVALLIMVFLSSTLVGLYPAYFGTKFHTVALLRGKIRMKGTTFLTKALVSMQFAISIIVLIGGLIFIANTKYQEKIEFGYNKEELLTIGIQDEGEFRRMKAKAEEIPQIKAFAATEHQVGYSTYPNPITHLNTEYQVRHLEFGENYFEAMGFEFLQGRPIDYRKANDFENAAVVSRAFVEHLDITDNPIGQEVDIRGTKRRIVGVIEDFVDNVYVSEEPEPFIFYPTVPARWREIVVRANERDLKLVNDKLEAVWKETFPMKPYDSQYQEDMLLENLRQTNANLQKIFWFLFVLGGFLSMAGIFSLASLNIAKRTKEIGIRKAMGATVENVLVILNKEFIVILLASAIVGCMGGYFGTSWLLGLIYAYHIPVTLGPVILSALIIFVLGVSTTSFTIFRAAQANPVDSLKDE